MQDSNQNEATNVEEIIDSGNGNGAVGATADGAETDNPKSKIQNPKSEDLAAQYLDALQRERASFINYRRRTEQERSEMAQYAASSLIKKLLPVVDDFDRALEAIPAKERKH